MTRRGALAAYLYAAAAAVYFLDRVTKLLAERYLASRPSVRVIPDVLHLTFTTNSGGAFGLLAGQPLVFFVSAVLICVAIVVASARLTSAPLAAGLGLILGGALGNLTDRMLRGPIGEGRVVDFIDLRVWPVFNLADSAIVIGGLVIVLASLRQRS